MPLMVIPWERTNMNTLWHRQWYMTTVGTWEECCEWMLSIWIEIIEDIFTHLTAQKTQIIKSNESVFSSEEQLPGLTWQHARNFIVVCCCFAYKCNCSGKLSHHRNSHFSKWVSVNTCNQIGGWSVTTTWQAGLSRIPLMAVAMDFIFLLFCMTYLCLEE